MSFFYSFITITLIAFIKCNDPLDKLSELKISDDNENNQETNQEQANNQVNETSEFLLTEIYIRLEEMITIIKHNTDISSDEIYNIDRSFNRLKRLFHSMPFSRELSDDMQVIDEMVTKLVQETKADLKGLDKAINIIQEIDPEEFNDDLEITKLSLKLARMDICKIVNFIIMNKNLVFKLNEEINESNISEIDVKITTICNVLKNKRFTEKINDAKKAVDRLLI